jgi:hypothetical protein
MSKMEAASVPDLAGVVRKLRILPEKQLGARASTVSKTAS